MSERTESGRTRRFTIIKGKAGWEVREELDTTVIRTTHYNDWHRVERAIEILKLQELESSSES